MRGPFVTKAYASGLMDRVLAARDRYAASAIEALEEDLRRRREAIIPDAVGRLIGDAREPREGDPLASAEQQMAGHQRDAAELVLARLMGSFPPAETEADIPTEDNIRTVFLEMMETDPEFREAAERAATFQQFRDWPGGTRSQ